MRTLIIRGRTFVQQFLITIRLFGRNGLANHAAAGAYGFLLSAVPALLVVALVLLAALRSSPRAVTELLLQIEFFRDHFENTHLIETFLSAAQPSVLGLVSILSVFWAARIFAQAIQRGLTIVFHGTKTGNFFLSYLMIFAVELFVIGGFILLALSSQAMVFIYEVSGASAGRIPGIMDSTALRTFAPMAGLALLCYCTYRVVPVNAPRRLSALKGTIAGIILYKLCSLLLGVFINEVRYNFIYGALGNLIILFGNVYFFFYFYFFGAQLAFVINSFDALLFSRFRQARGIKPGFFNLLERKIFSSPDGRLRRYLRVFRENQTIFTRGEDSNEVYYLLSGEAEIYLEDTEGSGPGTITVLSPGMFFGETAALLCEPRSASVKVTRETAVLALPPALFMQILESDTAMDRTIIEDLSRRLKQVNEKILGQE